LTSQNGLSTAGKRLRVGDVRSPALLPVLLAFSALVFAGILYLTSYKNFYYDEWDFISQYRPGQSTSIWLGHNEHWSTIPILLWKLLFVVVGLKSHIPYEAACAAGHVACVILLFILIRRRSGDLPAFAAASILLVFGSGGTNIVWAFQVGWVGSIAFGLSAMLLLESDLPFRRRVLFVSTALLASLMCSGVGLAFLAAVGAEVLFDANRRRYLLALVVPVLAFGVWFLIYGAGLAGTPGAPCPTCSPSGFGANFHHGPMTLDYFLTLDRFVVSAAASSLAGIVGLPNVGIVVLPILAVVIAFQWRRSKGIESWQLGMVAGLVAWFTLVGLGRAQTSALASADPHYLYVGAIFLLPLIANLVRSLPWRSWWRPALAAAFVVPLLSNAIQLRDLALNQVDLMKIENAELRTAQTFRGAPDLALDRRLDMAIMPQLTARSLFEASSQLGSPVPPSTVETLQQLPRQAVDFEMVNLFGEAFTVTSATSRSIVGLTCQTVDSTNGSTMDIRAPAGQSIVLQSSRRVEAWFFLAFLGIPTSEPLQKLFLPPATPQLVHLPDTGSPAVWRVRIQTREAGTIQVCGNATLETNHAGDNLYRAKATSGELSPGWSVVADPSASGGRAAKLPGGTSVVSFKNDGFGTWTVPPPGLYDVWFRVRVANPVEAKSEMTFGLWDGTARAWVASTSFAPNEASTSYSWIKAAAGITPQSQHYVQFLATFAGQGEQRTLSTDWFVDEAVLVPIGSPPAAT
jgi:hypothetical protein